MAMVIIKIIVIIRYIRSRTVGVPSELQSFYMDSLVGRRADTSIKDPGDGQSLVHEASILISELLEQNRIPLLKIAVRI